MPTTKLSSSMNQSSSSTITKAAINALSTHMLEPLFFNSMNVKKKGSE